MMKLAVNVMMELVVMMEVDEARVSERTAVLTSDVMGKVVLRDNDADNVVMFRAHTIG